MNKSVEGAAELELEENDGGDDAGTDDDEDDDDDDDDDADDEEEEMEECSRSVASKLARTTHCVSVKGCISIDVILLVIVSDISLVRSRRRFPPKRLVGGDVETFFMT